MEELKYTGSWRNEIFVGEVKFIVVEVKSTLQIRDSLCFATYSRCGRKRVLKNYKVSYFLLTKAAEYLSKKHISIRWAHHNHFFPTLVFQSLSKCSVETCQ